MDHKVYVLCVLFVKAYAANIGMIICYGFSIGYVYHIQHLVALRARTA